MSDVSFDEERTLAPLPQMQAAQPALVKLVIRWGFAKDEKGAHAVLIGVVVCAVILAIAVPLMLRQEDKPLTVPVVPLPFQPSGS